MRKFIPGSEWLYLKIYTGIKMADIILEELFGSLIQTLQEKNYISKWFFIRYNDPKPHLRFRLKLNRNEYYDTVLEEVNKVLKKYIDSGEISNVLIDTYTKEIERYGENSIEDAESLFHKNSEWVLQCLYYEDVEKIMVSLFYMDTMLDRLDLTIEEKLEWIKYSNNAFKNEFNADKKLNSQLDKKYREFKPKFLKFIESEEFSEERNEIITNIEESSEVLQSILNHHQQQSLGLSMQSFFQSIFHMSINRLFISNQRLFEMIVYDYMLRYYKSIAYRLSN